MADIHFEIFDNADFGNKNLRFSEAPAQEQRDFLKQNGYGFTTRYGGVWYPRTQSAKDRNADFVKEFAEKFYPENNRFKSQNQIDQLAEQVLEKNPEEIKPSDDDRIAYLESLIAELKEERKRDLEKISRLEAALENQNEENTEELEMQQEQAELDDEAEWEKENTLTDAEERAYIEKQSGSNVPAETIEITSEMMDSLHEAAEKESMADEPQAEKEILHGSEKQTDDDLTVSPEDLAVAKSVLPTVQYVSTLKFAQGEEREFFVHKIKEIAAAVEKAPKINETDGLEEHRVVLRYFHPSGTQSFVTEIGKDGDAFGFQCLNDDWNNAEWGYLNLDELKNIRGMEVDFHVPAGMTVEKFIQKEKSEQYSAENVTAEIPNEARITWNDILQAAEGSHWNDEANAVYNNARNQLAEYAKNLGIDIESSESPEEAAGTFAATHEEISFSKDGSLVIDESLKPVYFNDLSDEQKEEVINGYRSADDQQMLEAWQTELENSSETDKDIASNPPSDEWIANYLSETKADFNTGYWQDIFKDLEKEEAPKRTLSELSATEVSRLSEEKYGFYFEYSDDENVADIYSAKDGDFVGSYGEDGFGYADDLSGNDPTTKNPDENFREVLELAEIFYHKKADEYENLIETENGQMMTFAEAHEWNDEQKMQHSQEEDERDAEKADKDFEITKRLDEIVSEIKKSDFTLESKYENSLHSVSLKNKDGKVVFSAKENDNVVIPVEHTIAAWANDEASEKAKSLADEFFNLVCDDGIRGGDYVNAVFKREVPVEEDYEADLSESNISYTAENYYQVNEHFAIEIVPADSPLSSGKMGDDWIVRFYDIDYTEKFGEKGQFVTSYYASTMLEHKKGTGLSLQGDVPAWTLDAETMDYVHDIIFMWVDRHSSVQQNEDTEISQKEIEQEKAFVQKKIQHLKDELNNPENGGDEQQNSDVRKNIENLESLTDEDIKNQILWKRENQKKNDETRSRVAEQMMEEKLRNETPQEGELLSYNEKNPAYSVANKETKRETSIRPNGNPAENVKKLGILKNISEANEIIEKIKSSGFDILSTENRIIIFDENKYYDFNAHSDSGYFNYETKKFEFDFDKRNLNEWDFREYVKGGLKITKRMKDFAKIERMQNRKDYSPKYPEYAKNRFVLETGHKDGWAINDRHLVIWDRLLNRSARSGGFFDNEQGRATGEKELSEKIETVAKEENEALEKTYEGNGVYTCQFHTPFTITDKRATTHEMIFVGLKNLSDKVPENLYVHGLRESEAGEIKMFATDFAKKIGYNFEPRACIVFNPTDMAKSASQENISLANIAVLAEKLGTKIVVQDGNDESRYAFALDFAKKHSLPVYFQDNEIARKVSENVSDVKFYQNQSELIEALKNAEKQKENGKTQSYKSGSKSSQKKIREQCREILKKPDSEITEDDKKILAQYEGGGGLNENNRTNSEVLNAFYTPDNLIEKVWSLVDAYAPDAKSVLEPSAGVGRFAENRPDNEFTMHELDETSARINKILHPEANVIQGAFQKQFLDDGERFLKIGYEQPKYDVVIGNPPYGKYNDKYKGLGEGREFDRYEEYFIARGLDALKDEKSVLAFVVPSGFLNTADDRQKEIIASKGEILDAYRLPEGTFETTEVGTDILIMRKKGSIDDRENISGELLSNGEWFKVHPEKILGEMKKRTSRFGKEEEYVSVHEGLSVQDELNKIDSFAEEITEKNKSEKSFETQLAEYNRKYWGAVGQGDTRYDVSPVTEERLSEMKHLSKELSEYFENGVRPENDRFVIGKTPRVLQETGSEYTDVTVSVAVIKKAVETHGLSEKEILNALTRLATPILVFDSDKAATENKVDSKLVLTDVFKDEKPVALAVNTNSTVDINNRGLTVEVQDIRSIHDRTLIAKNGTDLVQKWTNDGLCRYVDDKKISEWSTVARVQFPIELLQSDKSNILTRTALVNSIYSEQTPLEETEKTEPEKQNPSSPKSRKEKWNIVKSKGEVMSAEEFSHLYGRDFDEREFPIWKATDWQGNIDLSKLSGDDIQYLSESGKYVEKNIGEWTHKELFASGDIYAKIQEQRELYAKSNGNKIFADNIKILESAMKSPLEMEKIHFGVKTTLAEEFKIEHIDAEGNKVNLNLQESFILWVQNARLSDQKWRGDIDFATANISREELGEELSFYDIVNYIDGKPVKAEPVRGWRTYDMSEEEKAAEKAELKKEADLKRQARSDTANRLFDRYLHEGLSEADKARLAAEYNRRFNSYVAPDYSKLPLFVDGMSAYKGDSKFKLYDQQIKGISFLCNKGNGLLAYDVGVGKTAAGIVATVNQIQTGRSSRPLIVVPNQVYPKWYTDIRQLFPNVKLNDLYNFGKDSVEKYIDSENPHRLNILENSISLCTYEALKNITFTDESCENELYEDFASLLSADMDGSARENAESSDKIKGVIGSASHVKDATYFFYEDCGFDNLTVDEAHNFKNLWVVPRPKKKGESNEYAGIPSGKPSARALKMYGMTQLTQRHNDDRNVFMLTATPFTNSPTEVYSMLSYIGRERLKQAGITSLRAFFDEFAQTKQELGVTSTGNIDTKQVMKNWKELSALQNILTEFIDKVDGEEAGIIRPNKFTHVKPLDMSDLQKQMRAIDEERMAEVKEGNSAAVIVAMNNMRLSCVAPALANPAMYPGVELPPLSKLVETSPKLKFVCDAIIDMYKGNPEKGQFMYVPLGKESHGIIKDYLVAHGIPKNAVEIINGEVNNTPEKKEKITSCFNDEKNPCKIIIGGRNTAEGIDLNGNSFVMYNCSLGWNPSETIQAEGRIWRQGNLQGNVHIVYPVMNDSIDSVLYQKHDEKRSRINELWNYKGDSLNVEDINPEDLKLDLIKDPHKKAKLILQEETKEARAELSRLNLKIKSFDEIIEKRKQLELDFSDAKVTVDYQKEQIESYKKSGLEVPEWIKSELRDYNKKFAKAENGLEKVREKLSSLKITDSEKEAEYIHNLNIQKHACEEKISHIEKTLPQVLKKLEIERMEQKLIEYPVEKQREILEADILNNLRPMKEVEYEIRTMRHEAMLSEKLKTGEITEKEFSLYKNAGYEKYEKWLNGEIESLEESSVKNEAANENSSIKNENDIEKIIVYYDGHWADERGGKGRGWKYQEKSFDNPKDALEFYNTAKIPKNVGAENKNGFRFNFMNPEERLLKIISEQNKAESVQKENVSEKAAVEKPEQTDLKIPAEKTEPAKQPEQDMDSLYSDSGSLFFGLGGSDVLSVHSPENEYRKSAPYDDFSITERQLTESELKRDEIIFPVLNGKESGMYKAFKDFAEHGVFDVQGKSVELDGSGRISGIGWNQLQAAMEIYRSKQFETFRYVLIGREDGEIKDQLAVKSYSPNSCAVSTPDSQTIKQVITRAEELDCMIAAVHNHPSGNTVESSFDVETTEALRKISTKENGQSRFAGHIILDHDTFNLYTPENGWKLKLNSNAYGNSEDNLVNKNFVFSKDSVDYTWQLENVAKKINDRNNWNDNFIPVVFADSLNHVSGIKLYDKSFFDNEPQKIRNELQFSGLEANSVKAFPVITKNFAETMSAVDELLFEDKLKNLVEHSAFIDAALPESTVTEKFNILPGRQYFDVHGAKMKNPDIEATWQTRINPALFSEPEQKAMRKKEVAFER